jgi:pimeloyl-ACP methyl ester carboxylesterase
MTKASAKVLANKGRGVPTRRRVDGLGASIGMPIPVKTSLALMTGCIALLCAGGPLRAQTADTAALYTSDRVVAVVPFDEAGFYGTFSHRRAAVDGRSVHYVVGGEGPVVVLLHGWPGTWYSWRHVMPALARTHTVIAVDMPGFGESQAGATADKVAVAARLKRMMDDLGHPRVSLVSHDMGGTVAYAYAAQFPEAVDRVVFSETAIPGFGFADGSENDLLKLTQQSAQGVWHFAFFMKPGVAEMLIPGRERELLRAMTADSMTNPSAMTEEEIAELTRWLSAPGGLTGGLDYYRSLFADAEANRALATRKLTMPVLVMNGGDGFLQFAGPPSVRAVASDVREIVVPHSGHFIAAERPGFVARALIDFLEERP